MRVVVRVVLDVFPPPRTHVRHFRITRRILRVALARRLVMIELGVRRVDISIARLVKLQAEIDILESDGEILFVKSADFPKTLPIDQQTSRRDGQTVSYQLRQIAVVLLVGVNSFEAMTGSPKDAENDSRMLNLPVWEKKPRPNRAHSFSLGVLNHCGQPFTRDHGDIVVEEKQKIFLDLSRGGVA